MTLRRLHRLSLRLVLVMSALAAAAVLMAVDPGSQPTAPASADPAYGNVKFNPSSQVVMEGYIFNIPVQMNTCADSPNNVKGTANSGTSTTLVDNAKSWTANQWTNYTVILTTGTGAPQQRLIIGNTGNSLTVTPAWSPVNPASGTAYEIYANSGNATAGASNTITDTTKSWTPNQFTGMDIVLISGMSSVQQRVVTSNTSNTITVSQPWGPIQQFGSATGGTTTTLSDDGALTMIDGTATGGSATTLVDIAQAWPTNQFATRTIELVSGSGSPQTRTVASNSATTITVSSAWSAQPAAGTVYRVWEQFAGYSLELTGPGGAQSRNIVSNTASTLNVSPAWATAQSTANATGGTSTTLVDTSKSWSTNAFANKTVELTGGPISPLSRTVLSNTSNTLTISGTWPISAAGSATSGTTTTIVDATKTWTTNEFTGFTIELVAGTGAPQTRTISSNTATSITVSPAWSTPPAVNTVYQVLRTPAASTQYIVRDGPAIGTGYQIRQIANPASGTGYQLLRLKCHLGGYDLQLNYQAAKFTVVTGSGLATSATSNTLVDTTKAWKINQWVGTQLKITSGAGFGQARNVISNTATSLTVSPAWASTPPSVIPSAGSGYALGGMVDGGWLASTGRIFSCPAPVVYGSGYASLGCVTYQPLPEAPTGSGNIVNITLQAGSHQGNVLQSFTLTNVELLQVDGTVIPADVIVGSRRVILCPDSAPITPGPDGILNPGDQAVMAQAVLAHATANPPHPLYSTRKDPNEDGVVNPGDQAILASVIGKRCVQL